MRNIGRLLDHRINVTITILFLPENEEEVLGLVEYLADFGVQSVKLVYPNVREISTKMVARFNKTVRALQDSHFGGLEIRWTDFDQTYCLLRDRGFLSLTIPDFRLSNCCVLVNTGKAHKIESLDIGEFSRILMEMHEQSSGINGYPCESYIGACPISLQNIHKYAQNASSLTRLSGIALTSGNRMP